MKRIAATYPCAAHPTAPKANVIVYQMESLSDLSRYGVTFRTDPLAFFHQLARQFPSGRLMVPIYGGNSCNTEFEILTGFSRINPYPLDFAYAYRQFVTRKTPSLAWVFKQYGYATAVISGGNSHYFNQKHAYPLLGFEQFLALDDRPKVQRSRGLVDDEAVVDEVIAYAQQHRRFFLSVMTNSTHAPYDRIPLDARFSVTNKKLSAATRTYYARYASALSVADQALKRLIRFLEQHSQPTLLFVYGDHQPSMPSLFEAGLMRTTWPESMLDKYTTPLVLWANFPLEAYLKKKPLLISTNLLAAAMFQALGISHPPSPFHYTTQVYQRFSVVSHLLVDHKGRFYKSAELQSQNRTLFHNYGMIKYDLLVGARHSLCKTHPVKNVPQPLRRAP